MVGWELPNDLIKEGENAGKPFGVSAFYTVSLSEKANLRHDLEAWRGRDFTGEELASFNLKNILGVPAYINVIHKKNQAGTKTNAKVGSIMPLPAEMTCPPAVNEPIFFDWDEGFNREVFDKIPEGIQGIIKKSYEYREAVGGVAPKENDEEPPPMANAVEDGDTPPF